MTSEIKATVQALVDALEDLVALDFYETDYDGHDVQTCPSCGKQDGEHNKYCAFVTAQAAILAGQQLLAQEGEKQEPVRWRVYLIAHAPAEPQSWFSPDLPPEPKFIGYEPKFAGDPKNFTKEDKAKFSDLQRRHAEYRGAVARHAAECNKLRYTQWPVAWADAVLAASAPKETV